MLAGPGPAGGALIGWRSIGETEIPVEALFEVLGGLFEVFFEWRKDRAEKGTGAQETVQLGGQQVAQEAGSPYSYQLGGRSGPPQDGQQAPSAGTSSRRGIRQ